MDANERARLDSSKRRVLQELAAAGADGLLNWQLVSRTGALDAPRRARELRASGFAVEVVREDGGTWRYRLLQSAPVPVADVERHVRQDEQRLSTPQPQMAAGGRSDVPCSSLPS